MFKLSRDSSIVGVQCRLNGSAFRRQCENCNLSIETLLVVLGGETKSGKWEFNNTESIQITGQFTRVKCVGVYLFVGRCSKRGNGGKISDRRGRHLHTIYESDYVFIQSQFCGGPHQAEYQLTTKNKCISGQTLPKEITVWEQVFFAGISGDGNW